MALRDVLLLTPDADTVKAVSAALESNGQLTNDNVYRDLRDLALRLERGGVPAVLVDIDGPNERILPALEGLARKFSETRFIALSGVMRNDLLLEAMQVGVRHFMLKESVPNELAGVLHRLCPDAPTGVNGGAVTILSAGGGCGATTVAVNLAAELQAGTGSPALVVDLDPAYGAVGTYLGLDGEHGVLDLMHRMGPIDGQLIQSTSLSNSKELAALLATNRNRLGESVSLDAQQIGQIAEACRSAYKWTTIDAPRVPPDIAAELALRSTATLLLLQLTIKDIQVARRMIRGLKERGVPADRLFILAARYRKRTMLITLEEAQRALGLDQSQPLGMLSNDFSAVQQAVNLGKPLSQTSPRSDLRKDLQKLAAQIAAMPHPAGSHAAARASSSSAGTSRPLFVS